MKSVKNKSKFIFDWIGLLWFSLKVLNTTTTKNSNQKEEWKTRCIKGRKKRKLIFLLLTIQFPLLFLQLQHVPINIPILSIYFNVDHVGAPVFSLGPRSQPGPWKSYRERITALTRQKSGMMETFLKKSKHAKKENITIPALKSSNTCMQW